MVDRRKERGVNVTTPRAEFLLSQMGPLLSLSDMSLQMIRPVVCSFSHHMQWMDNLPTAVCPLALRTPIRGDGCPAWEEISTQAGGELLLQLPNPHCNPPSALSRPHRGQFQRKKPAQSHKLDPARPSLQFTWGLPCYYCSH